MMTGYYGSLALAYVGIVLMFAAGVMSNASRWRFALYIGLFAFVTGFAYHLYIEEQLYPLIDGEPPEVNLSPV